MSEERLTAVEVTSNTNSERIETLLEWKKGIQLFIKVLGVFGIGFAAAIWILIGKANDIRDELKGFDEIVETAKVDIENLGEKEQGEISALAGQERAAVVATGETVKIGVLEDLQRKGAILSYGSVVAYKGELKCQSNDSSNDISKCISDDHLITPIDSTEWYVCNGATLAGKTVADMKDRFLKMTSNVDGIGGNSEIGSHTHHIEAGGPGKSNQRVVVNHHNDKLGTSIENYSGTAITVVTSTEKDTNAQSNDPEYYGVVFITRIKS